MFAYLRLTAQVVENLVENNGAILDGIMSHGCRVPYEDEDRLRVNVQHCEERRVRMKVVDVEILLQSGVSADAIAG